eukprot:6457498-Amphidinium_carterae.1
MKALIYPAGTRRVVRIHSDCAAAFTGRVLPGPLSWCKLRNASLVKHTLRNQMSALFPQGKVPLLALVPLSISSSSQKQLVSSLPRAW